MGIDFDEAKASQPPANGAARWNSAVEQQRYGAAVVETGSRLTGGRDGARMRPKRGQNEAGRGQNEVKDEVEDEVEDEARMDEIRMKKTSTRRRSR